MLHRALARAVQGVLEGLIAGPLEIPFCGGRMICNLCENAVLDAEENRLDCAGSSFAIKELQGRTPTELCLGSAQPLLRVRGLACEKLPRSRLDALDVWLIHAVVSS